MKKKNDPSLQCYEIWRGNEKIEKDVQFAGLRGFLFSLPFRSAHGGDVYFLASCEEGGLARIIMADMCGHGDIASWAAGQIEKLLRDNINEIDDSKLLESMNDSLARELSNGEFVTMAAATYRSADRALAYACAGHPAHLRYDVNGKRWKVLPSSLSGVPLGITNNRRYPQMKTNLNRGDMLLFYTDGLLSIRNETGSQLSVEKLLSLCQEATPAITDARSIVKALVERIKRASTSGFNDDLTLLLLEVL